MERDSYECPGRGNRAKCPSFRRYNLFETLKRTQDERISLSQNSNSTSLLVDIHSQTGGGCVNPRPVDQARIPTNYATFENVKKRSKRCMICLRNEKDGSICPGRGNRALCPDYTSKI